MPIPTPTERFLFAVKDSLYRDSFAELVLDKYQGLDRRMRALSVRQTRSKPGEKALRFISVHLNHESEVVHPLHEALGELRKLMGPVFREACLVTMSDTYQLCFNVKGTCSLKITPTAEMPSQPEEPADDTDSAPAPDVSTAIPWAQALEAGAKKAGITDAATFRSPFINEFLAWFTPLFEYAARPNKKKTASAREQPATIVQLGSGLGQLAFALATTLGTQARVHGIDAHQAAVDLCNRVAGAERLINLAFTKPPAPDAAAPELDVLIALNARDTDADEALANGVAAGASLIVVEPCAHRELRATLSAPSVWPEAICQEALIAHQASSITDTFRALLMACAGYKIKTFARPTVPDAAPNLIIAAIKSRVRNQVVPAETAVGFARIYGIRQQRLAQRMGLSL